ncbi:S-adenosyl-L-methionine-dependentmethyltransferases superfamily protein [Striga asiatica]|uniref:S-adenosyl-L-methionine-dependentmethyltransferases superfamily protein n=1 Tax=Striga asiatica TaxID=4170 RepID=A0A5A7P646_STRAF|nr:S-adenosyl-L-methionine-dependentmethyltransferases superfamily protein [Striga asiatica]
MSCCSPQLRLSLTATCYSPSPSPALKSAKHGNFGSRKSKLRQPNTLFIKAAAGVGQEEKEEEEEFRVLTAVESRYNRIVILDTPKSRLLLLDSTNNVHSVFNKEGSKLTGSYWDEFVALPPVVPEGPIAIFGLGGGTAAHLMLDLWPSLQLDGWEIDEILIDQSRDYLGLRDLEKHTTDGGFLNIHIGDVFSPDAAITGGYAGIIVDLFSGGKVLPQLEQAATWWKLHDKLMPNGRFMVNCGAGQNRLSATHEVCHKALPMTGAWRLNPTIRALCQAFPGQVNWKKLPPSAGENYLALTGSLPDMTTWSAALPNELKTKVNQWRFCYTHDS